MTRTTCPAVLGVALLAWSCAGAPEAPTGVRFGISPSFDQLTLHWNPPGARVTAYEVDMRMEDGEWSRVEGEIPGEAVGIYIAIAPEAPEVVTLQARVRARRGGSVSRSSSPASILRGLRPIEAANAIVDGVERVRLDITQGSTASPRVLVERSLLDDLTGTWSTFAPATILEPGTANWLDTSDLAGRALHYQVRNIASYRGAPVESPAIWVEPGQRPGVAPPTDLNFVLGASGPMLSWTNRSRIATTIRIERAPGLLESQGTVFEPPFAAVATLPPEATSWEDAVSEGAYTYRAVALAGAYPGSSASVQAVVPPTGLGAAIALAPQGDHVLRDDGGGLWVDGVNARVWVWTPATSGWARHALDGASAVAPPGVILDGGGLPHLLVQRPVPNGTTLFPTDLVHTWHDGAAWQEELIAQRTLDFAFLTLDPAGTLHAAWQEHSGGFPEVAARGATGWTVTRLDSALYSDRGYTLSGFGAGADGALWLLVFDRATGLFLHSRPSGGTWAEASVPTTGYVERALLVPQDGGATVVYQREVQGDPVAVQLAAVARTGAGWAATVELGSHPGPAGRYPWMAASSGGRLAVLTTVGTTDGLWLYRWDAAAGASATRLGQATGWDPAFLGFTAAGKLWALSPSGARLSAEQLDAGLLRAYLSLEEP